ncbi:MAG: hypothetical protein A2731_02255 [Candidatus Buchananbacteria bacterium RIFCSPHIGHO2_01_FULL_39_8]|uniref:ATP-grasp domain-containing protein n=1 Tax=Candidatus Buchananbacteria bacterium RIFCSPHIGHO2_01_FULL_39_8 TaxID=1797533 RepID=A0A1G1XVU0_9BACT|nr:MAG: hypothetical protein A2731_02255 [Candidatus Buchananbacteria bacterium RIFCSPHIGHO2_01_FULL_39_8]
MNSDSKDKTILLVNTGPIKKRFTVQKLKKMGFKVIALNREKNWAQPYVDHWIIADLKNYSESIEQVRLFLTNNPDVHLDGAITFWEESVLLTSKIIDSFHLIGVPFRIARQVRNKYLFREFCQSHGIPAPRHIFIRKRDNLKEVKEKLNYPVVIKPVYGSSSAFVIRTENEQELFEAYDYIQKNISSYPDAAEWDDLKTLVEEYIDGDEVDIDLLLQNGKIKFYSISDNFNKSKGSFFVDSGQAIPSSLPIKDQNDLINMTEEILEKLGIYNGCLHVEAKSTKHGPVPLEVNIRMGGDYVYSYNKTAWNIDLIEYAALIAVGQFVKINRSEVPHRYIIGWDLHPNESGVLAELSNIDYLKKNRNIEEVEIYKTIGDSILVPPEGFESLGWLTVGGENILDAQDNLNAILKLISYKVVKFDPESALGKTERKNRFSPAVLNKNLFIRTAKIEAMKKAGISDLRRLKIGILANIYENPADPIAKYLSQIPLGLENAFKGLGYQVSVINLNNFSEVVDSLKNGDIDIIFNLGEKLYDDISYRSQIAALLDCFQVPYTGSDFSTISRSVDKIYFKKVLSYHEIPTPDWDYAYDLDDEIDDELQYPLIVKPSGVGHCFGISQSSVVTNKEELDREIKRIILEMKRPALIEEYIDGDEYEVYILGNEEENLRILPLSRTIFNGQDKNLWHIYTYESRWLDDKVNENFIRQMPPKNISKRLESLITEIALDTYNILGCKDYGKVDIKVDQKGNPYVIELNPSPWLYDFGTQGIVAAAKLAGIGFNELLEEIIRLSTDRYGHRFKAKNT